MGRKSVGYIRKKGALAVEDFREFQVPKIVQVTFLIAGIGLGVGVAAIIKNSMKRQSIEAADEVVAEETPEYTRPRTSEKSRRVATQTRTEKAHVPTGPVPEPRANRKSIQERQAPAPAPVAAVAPKRASYISPAPVAAPAPAPAPVAVAAVEREVEASKPAAPQPKRFSLQGLTYDRSSFQACGEDCTINMKAGSGQSIRVRFSKSNFAHSLDRLNARVDIEGLAIEEQGHKVILLETVRAYPKKEVAEPVRVADEEDKVFPQDSLPAARKEVEVKADVETAREKEKKKEEKRAETKRSQPQNLKSRLEEASGKSKPDDSDEAESGSGSGSSFQDRLRKSVR